ncbi:tetratricopeptide repeat protein [Stenotrophomonas maltophilia]
MDFGVLDSEELLRLAVDAAGAQHQADAMVFLKVVLQREPEHVQAAYLLAAQHAQLGMLDRAESGFRKVVAAAPDLAIARFQYAQLLMGQGRAEEARQMLAPVLAQVDALGAYARALHAAADQRMDDALRELDEGLAQPQALPALAIDMRRLRDQLAGSVPASLTEVAARIDTPAPIFLTGYGRTN